MKLPDELLEEYPATKLLYTWLLPQGEVSFSVRELEEALGLDAKTANQALNRLRELDLIEDLEEPEERRRGRYRAK